MNLKCLDQHEIQCCLSCILHNFGTEIITLKRPCMICHISPLNDSHKQFHTKKRTCTHLHTYQYAIRVIKNTLERMHAYLAFQFL